MKKFLAIFISCVLCLTLLAGCGGETSDTGSGDEGGAGNGSGSAAEGGGYDWGGAETMKIAVLTNLTGASKEYGDRARWVMDYGQEQINAAGGVLGKEVELVYFDIGSDQQSFITALQNAVHTEGISATIGYFGSQYTVAGADIILESGIPNIATGTSASVRDLQNPYIWQVRMVDEIATKLLAQLSYEEYGVQNPAVVYMTNASGQSQFDAYKAGMEELGGAIGLELGYDNTTTSDFSPLITQVMNSDADGLIVVATVGSEGVLLAEAIKQFGYDKPVGGVTSLFAESYLDLVQGAADGMYGISEYYGSAGTPGLQEWIDGVTAKDEYFGLPGWTEGCQYDALFLLVEAAGLAGSIEPGKVNEGLGQINGYQGVLSSYTAREDHSFADYVWIAEIQDNEIVVSEQLYRD